MVAARDGNAECVRYLVSKGCDPTHLDSAGQTALFYACRDGRTDIVKLLAEEMNVDLNLQDKAGQTALFYAARDGQLGTIKYMLTQVWQASPLHTIIRLWTCLFWIGKRRMRVGMLRKKGTTT